MRDDQLKRLEALQEKLIDAVAIEMDPDFWPGAFDEDGQRKRPGDLTKDERGDRYWCKKNAAQTLTIITKVESLAAFRNRQTDQPLPDETSDDIEKEIKRHEKASEELLAKFQKRLGGTVGHA